MVFNVVVSSAESPPADGLPKRVADAEASLHGVPNFEYQGGVGAARAQNFFHLPLPDRMITTETGKKLQ